MGNIVLLDDLTINKIAAGEVIERPASVIKEMVENSIDAGATNITVEIKNGGISYIKISDNGKGIAQDDLEIAFERHATSKIRTAEDLDTVRSMGFRGEALASIAAISNVEMISKTEEQESGYRIVVEAGKVLEKEVAASPVGTTIIVKNLFFNTPVRYKFLKKDYTESGYIEDVITRIALVNPSISFKFINMGKTIIQTNGSGSLKEVIYSIYGKNVAEAVMPVSYMYEGITIEGMVGKAEIARSNRSNQLFFVNKRYIKDKTLTAATEQAYKGMIPLGKFGFVVLNITMDPAKVDVNVHPAKLEVRFQEESKIFQSVYHAIKDTLLKNNGDKGLFSLRKSDNQEIEKYTDLESKIKTNMQEIDKMKNSDEEVNTSGLVDTSDILRQLEKIKEDMHNKMEQELSTPDMIKNNQKDLFDLQKPNTNIQPEEKDLYQEFDKEEIKGNSIIERLIELKDVTNKLEDTQESNELEPNDTIPVAIPQENSEEKKETQIIDEKKPEEEINNENKIEEDTKNEINNENESNIEEQKQEETTLEPKNNEEIIEQKETQNIEEQDNTQTEEKNEENNNDDSQKQKENQDITIENNEEPKYEKTMNFDEMYQKLFGKAPSKSKVNNRKEQEDVIPMNVVEDNMSVFDQIDEYQKEPYKFIGIIFNTYIIIEINNEMYIIDQHAAHERIMYEKVKANYYSDDTKDSQMLLLPDVIILTHKEMAIARENMEMFAKAGFSLEEFGDNTIELTGVPDICLDLNTKDLFLETLDEINTVARTAKQEKEEKFISTVACKAAVKANMSLTEEEVKSLIDKLLDLPNPFSCPHGRPTAIKMTKYDIERKFSRK